MIPKRYLQMHEEYPDFMAAYEALGKAAKEAGPLDEKSIALTKLGISLGAGLEGGSRSHARKALEAGCTAAELRHVVLLATPTIGFPTMMRARSWVEDVLVKHESRDGG